MNKCEIIIFILLIVLQGFSIPVGTSFGIPILVIFLIVYCIKNLFKENYSIKFLSIWLIIIYIMIASCIINNNYNFIRILRNNMLIFVGFYTFIFIKKIYSKNMEKYFWRIFFIIISILCVYGVYQYIAPFFGTPFFLNIFYNNPSYSSHKDLYGIYGGWVDKNRIYVTFFEPSVWAIFLDIIFVNLISNKYIDSRIKIYVGLLIILNIYLTYSRSGWAILIYFGILYLIMTLILRIKELKFIYPVLKVIVIFMPFINMIGMYLANIYIFDDLSSKGRTSSAIYYFTDFFKGFTNIIFGYGAGAISQNYSKKLWDLYYVEPFAHNGYVEIMYEYGLIIFLLLIYYCILKLSKKISNKKDSLIVVILFSIINTFGTMIYVESILSMLVIFYLYYYYNSKEENSTNMKPKNL